GVPVRRVEAAAWFGSGLVSGFAGLLLSNLVGLDAATLTFLVISSLAAALIARLRSRSRRSRCSTCRARRPRPLRGGAYDPAGRRGDERPHGQLARRDRPRH